MKKLAWKLIIPLTVISFFLFTKWWYTLPVDAPDTVFIGFPFPFVCNGWHTSMSLQVFIFELIVDLLIYFIFWFSLIFIFNLFVKKIYRNKLITGFLLSIAVVIVIFSTWIASSKDNIFYLKRDFKMEVMETGYKFIWQKQPLPDFKKYHPEKVK